MTRSRSWVEAALTEPGVNLREVAKSVADSAVFAVTEEIFEQGVKGKLGAREIDTLHRLITEIVLARLQGALREPFADRILLEPCRDGRRPAYLRLVVPVVEQADRTVIDRASGKPAETDVDRAIAPVVEAGRRIIGAGVAAIVDAATGYGLDWNPDDLRSGIVDVVVRYLHDEVIVSCVRDGIDPNAAARHLTDRRDGDE